MTDKILLPKKLTAEEGYKGLLSGEFFETITVSNESYCGCGQCDFCEDFPDVEEYEIRKVPISWDNIKRIYEMIVEFTENQRIN